MALKVQTLLLVHRGQQSLMKAKRGNTPVYIANRCHVSHQRQRVGVFLPPLSSSTNGSAAPCTSSKVHCLVGSSGAQAQPSLCSLKTHFVD